MIVLTKNKLSKKLESLFFTIKEIGKSVQNGQTEPKLYVYTTQANVCP